MRTGSGTEREDGTLGARAAAGVLWSVAQKWAMRIGGLVTVAVLARLLTPAEFGVVAAATAFIPIVYLISDMGFSTYVVQAEDVSPRLLSTAFWYTITAGTVFGLVLLVVSPHIARSLGQPQVGPVLSGLAPTVLLVALSSVPIALLRRRLAFRALAIQSFVAALLGQVVAVVAALGGAGAWALVAQLWVNHAVVALLACILARYRPGLAFSWEQFVTMARFGTKVIGVELIAMTRYWAEAAIVTAALGLTGLGYLNIAQRLIQAAQDLSASAVVPVSTVVFAKVRSTAERLVGAYVNALELLYLVVMPVMVLVFVAAPLLVPLAFGDQWSDSVAPARALAVAGLLTLAASLDNGLLYGMGRPGRWLAYALVIDVLTVATTWYAVRFGLLGVAVGFVGVASVATAVRWVVVARTLRAPVWAVARPFVMAGATTLVGASAGVLVLLTIPPMPDLAALVLVGGTIGVVHTGAVRLLLPAQFARAVRLVLRRRPAFGGAPGRPRDDPPKARRPAVRRPGTPAWRSSGQEGP